MENKKNVIILAVNIFVIRDGQVLLGKRKGKIGEGNMGTSRWKT